MAFQEMLVLVDRAYAVIAIYEQTLKNAKPIPERVRQFEYGLAHLDVDNGDEE